MTTGNLQMTVNVDKLCNEALAEFAENFYKKTGLRLQHVNFKWLAVTTPSESSHILQDVSVATVRNTLCD